MFSIREIFDLAVRIEENGEKFYREALKGISVLSIRSLIEWLADEEVKHKEWFLNRRNTVKAKTDNIQMEDMGSRILKEIMGDQTFSLKEVDVGTINTLGDLIAIAIEFERDTVLFFEMLSALVDDKTTTEGLAEIIEEENRHIALLEDFQLNGHAQIKAADPGGKRTE